MPFIALEGCRGTNAEKKTVKFRTLPCRSIQHLHVSPIFHPSVALLSLYTPKPHHHFVNHPTRFIHQFHFNILYLHNTLNTMCVKWKRKEKTKAMATILWSRHFQFSLLVFGQHMLNYPKTVNMCCCCLYSSLHTAFCCVSPFFLLFQQFALDKRKVAKKIESIQ